MALPPREVLVQPTTGFERFAVDNTGVCVSVCRECLKFIAAAPDPVRLALAESLHLCARGVKKPPARALPGKLDKMRAGFARAHAPELRH